MCRNSLASRCVLSLMLRAHVLLFTSVMLSLAACASSDDDDSASDARPTSASSAAGTTSVATTASNTAGGPQTASSAGNIAGTGATPPQSDTTLANATGTAGQGADATVTPSSAPDGSVPQTPVAAANPPAADLPPTGDAAALEAWLTAASYKNWHCEDAPHATRPPGAHGRNRVCTNDALTGAAAGAFPVGAAAVKELYDSADALIGYAVSEKLEADSASGAGWYWYERSGSQVFADSRGLPACTGCHGLAGPDFASTARDYVYTVVP